MTIAEQEPPRCPRCNSPWNYPVSKCPFCGETAALDVVHKPVQPAIVGLSDRNEAAKRNRTAPTLATPPSTTLSPTVIIAALVLLLAAAALVFMIRRQPPSQGTEAVSQPDAPKVEPQTKPPLNLAGIVLPDSAHVDPTDLLPQVHRRVKEGDEEARLIGIEVVGARGGEVNLESDGVRILYRSLMIPRDSRKAAQQAELTLDSREPGVRRVSTANALAPGDPTCVWSAAWRAARGAGIADTEVVDATFTATESVRHGVWVFTPRDRPQQAKTVDGLSCAIKSR